MSSDNSGLVASALQKSNPALALTMDAANSFKAEVVEHGARVTLYRNYERGDHRAVITTQMRKMLRLTEDKSGMVDFNGNYCGIVVDKMAGRLHVNEITTGDEATDKDWLVPTLESNDWGNLQSTTFRGAIRDADSYVMIDPLTLAWTSEPAYDGYSGIVAMFEQGSRTPMWACKVWSEVEEESNNNTMRLVVYQPGVVSYWRGMEGGAEVVGDLEIGAEDDLGVGHTRPLFPRRACSSCGLHSISTRTRLPGRMARRRRSLVARATSSAISSSRFMRTPLSRSFSWRGCCAGNYPGC